MFSAISAEELKKKLPTTLRILVPALSKSWGGLERTVVSDIYQLKKEKIFVVALVREGSVLEQKLSELGEGVQVESYKKSVKKLFDLSLIRTLRHLMRSHGINLVHFHHQNLLNNIFLSLLNRGHIGLVLSRHILNNHSKKGPIYALLFRRIDYILVSSETMRSNLLQTFAVRSSKLRIVPLGIDLERFDPVAWPHTKELRKKWEVPEDCFLVGVIGRLDPNKNQDVVIKALAQLQKEISDLYLVLVGAETEGLGGSYQKKLQEAIRELHLQDRVFLVGEEERVPEAFLNLDLFILPSKDEAYGLVVLEAMAMGVPCILSQSGGLEEIADRGRRAILFPLGDVFDLSRKIRELYLNPSWKKELSEGSRAFVEEFHSLRARLDVTLGIYTRCGRRRWGKLY